MILKGMSRFFQVTLVSGSQQQPQKAFSELKTLEWWISGLMLDPLFFLISRLNKACSPLVINLQIN